MALSPEELEEAIERTLAIFRPIPGHSTVVEVEKSTEQALTGARQSGRQVALHFLDLDRFREVNDSFGHNVGDALLQAVGARLGSIVGPDDTSTRLNGDEFVLLQVGVPGRSGPAAFATRVLEAVRRPLDDSELFADGAPLVGLSITCSVGIAIGTPDATPRELLEQADAALYGAKAASGHPRKRGDRFVFFDELPGMAGDAVPEAHQEWP